MATTLQPLRLTARSCNCREMLHQYASRPASTTRRALSSTARRWEKSKPIIPSAGTNPRRLDAEQSLQKLTSTNASIVDLVKTMSSPATAANDDLSESEFLSLGHAPPVMEKQKKKKPKDTFLNMGDPDPWEEDGQLEDDHDDITSLGHGELEKHREMRHYARLAAWEMPLLANMAKTFEPPTADMPLRFRYTSYLGEQHPAEKKVVLEFSPADMPNLTDVQREKLKKLAGVRYNPDKDIIKISCDSFETQSQNKRYLGDLVDSLLHESRTGDSFEDVPLDLRHHRVKPKPKFPMEWALTEERKAQLAQFRKAEASRDAQKQLAGTMVDGLQQIAQGITQATLLQAAEPELVTVGKGKKKVSVRR